MTLYPGVDIALARRLFESSAKTGCWASLNNLGVIYRDGLGVNPNPTMAFSFFEQAAKEANPITLRHLVRCYREGIGCPVDHNVTTYIDSIIGDLEAAHVKERQGDRA